MEEKELKTSPKQRFFIILIAILMVGSIIASYAAIVISGSQGANTSAQAGEVDQEKIAQYETAYNELKDEFMQASAGDYKEFSKYKSEVKAYNETSANENGVQTKDLKEGSGKHLA